MKQVGDKIQVKRLRGPRHTEYEEGEIVRVCARDEFWVKLPGYEGSILYRPSYSW